MIAKNDLSSEQALTNEFQSHSPIRGDDDKINEKYKRGEIRIVTEQARYPLDTIQSMLESNKYILTPEYQRRKRWDITRKSRLIESFIMNVPIPPIFLYEIDYSIYEVMDGQQRLTTIDDFYKGKFRLENLQYWQELENRTYQELPEQVKRGIDRRYLSSIILLQETAKSQAEAEKLKKVVFERLNSGGEKLTPQEIRNALYNGKFNQLCIELAQNDFFRKMWNIPLESEGEKKLLESEAYRKMEDVELVLRFFAYRSLDEITSPLDNFLDDYLKQANNYDDAKIKDLKNLFNDTINLIYSLFGESAFLSPKPEENRRYNAPAKIVYDSMMQAFANNLSEQEKLIQNREYIKNNLYSDPQGLYFKEETDRSDRYLFDSKYVIGKYLKLRIKYFHNFLQQSII